MGTLCIFFVIDASIGGHDTRWRGRMRKPRGFSYFLPFSELSCQRLVSHLGALIPRPDVASNSRSKSIRPAS